jgi:predicted amidohydrolase
LEEAGKEIALVFGFVEEDDYIYYNSAAMIEGGKVTVVHRKVYLPTYGMFDEERYFSPGSTFRAFESGLGRAAILICEDFWHPSSIYLAARDGAMLHFYLANTPLKGLSMPEDLYSPDLATSMARINSQVYGVYTIYANRTGCEDGVSFAGCSRVVSPTGRVVAKAEHQDEELILAEIDPDQIRRARIFSPLMGDNKLDLVHRELSRIRARMYKLKK